MNQLGLWSLLGKCSMGANSVEHREVDVNVFLRRRA